MKAYIIQDSCYDYSSN